MNVIKSHTDPLLLSFLWKRRRCPICVLSELPNYLTMSCLYVYCQNYLTTSLICMILTA